MNRLYYGDNLAALRASIGDETVDPEFEALLAPTLAKRRIDTADRVFDRGAIAISSDRYAANPR